MSIQELKLKIVPILKSHKIGRAGIFGSLARQEEGLDSDIDLLVELCNDMSLLDFVGLKLELEDITGKKVDLVEYDALKPGLKDRILKEEISIL